MENPQGTAGKVNPTPLLHLILLFYSVHVVAVATQNNTQTLAGFLFACFTAAVLIIMLLWGYLFNPQIGWKVTEV